MPPAFVRLGIAALCCVTFTRAAFAAATTDPARQDYLDSLITQSRQQQLAQARTWQVLLHYRNNTFSSGVTSEIDDAAFFLAENGKTDADAELVATLEAFFGERRFGEQKQLAQCAYPARYRWLKKELGFDPELLPQRSCALIEQWRANIDASSVSLIFSSYFLNNPASMFGHTLLRFNSRDPARPSLLDYAVNYAADIGDSDSFVEYAWKGIGGGFEGRFSIYPYYDMVKLYNDLENRDLWEYRLNLSPAQIDFMLLHLWELVHTHYDFYFLRENCSYHLLSLLELAEPGLRLRAANRGWTIPTDTIRQVVAAGLVTGVERRPSLGSWLEFRLARLDAQERAWARRLVDDAAAAKPQDFRSLPDGRRVEILDAAINWLQYRDAAARGSDEAGKADLHALLLERSRLSQPDLVGAAGISPEPVPPDQGHKPFRLEIAGGRFRDDDDSDDEVSFAEIAIQPGFHDLLAPEAGHAPHSQINVFNLRARYDEEDRSWQLQNLALLDVLSLAPLSAFLREPSWKLYLGARRNRDSACGDCTPFIFNPGIGVAAQSRLHRNEVYYALLEADLQFDHEFDDDYRGGFAASLGLLFEVSERWRLALAARRVHFTDGQEQYSGSIDLRQRYYLTRNSEILFDLVSIEEVDEGRLGIAWHF